MKRQILYSEILKFLNVNRETSYELLTEHIEKLAKNNIINYEGYKGRKLHRKIGLDISEILGYLVLNGIVTLLIDFENLQRSLILVKGIIELQKEL